MDMEKLIDQLTRIENSMSELLEDKAPRATKTTPFQPRTDFFSLQPQALSTSEVAARPQLVLKQLGEFFQAAVLLQRRAWSGKNLWTACELICHGQAATVAPLQQTDLSYLMKFNLAAAPSSIAVRRVPASQLLPRLPLPLAHLDTEGSFAYLVLATADVAYILFSQTPALWSEDQMLHTHQFINQVFTESGKTL